MADSASPAIALLPNATVSQSIDAGKGFTTAFRRSSQEFQAAKIRPEILVGGIPAEVFLTGAATPLQPSLPITGRSGFVRQLAHRKPLSLNRDRDGIDLYAINVQNHVHLTSSDVVSRNRPDVGLIETDETRDCNRTESRNGVSGKGRRCRGRTAAHARAEQLEKHHGPLRTEINGYGLEISGVEEQIPVLGPVRIAANEIRLGYPETLIIGSE